MLLSFNPSFSLILLNLEGSRGGTRKGTMFWVERLIINLAKELGFRGTWFHFAVNLQVGWSPSAWCWPNQRAA